MLRLFLCGVQRSSRPDPAVWSCAVVGTCSVHLAVLILRCMHNAGFGELCLLEERLCYSSCGLSLAGTDEAVC